MLPEIIRIQDKVFSCVNREKSVNHSRAFRDIFYATENKDKVLNC
jgi:uncharacterized Zn-finger protein